MKKLLTIAFMFIFALGLQAQEEDSRLPDSDSKIMIGLAAGFTSGTGISVRTVQKQHGVTLTVLPYFTSQENNPANFINLGLSYNYYFRQNDFVDFSMKFGTQYLGGDVDFDLSFGEASQINVGIGPEINIHIVPELDLEFYLGYGLYDIADSLNSSLTAGVGFYYNIYQ